MKKNSPIRDLTRFVTKKVVKNACSRLTKAEGLVAAGRKKQVLKAIKNSL